MCMISASAAGSKRKFKVPDECVGTSSVDTTRKCLRFTLKSKPRGFLLWFDVAPVIMVIPMKKRGSTSISWSRLWLALFNEKPNLMLRRVSMGPHKLGDVHTPIGARSCKNSFYQSLLTKVEVLIKWRWRAPSACSQLWIMNYNFVHQLQAVFHTCNFYWSMSRRRSSKKKKRKEKKKKR